MPSANCGTCGVHVDRIRQRGNIANHELPASTEEQSLTTIMITEHLLRSAYEFALLDEGA